MSIYYAAVRYIKIVKNTRKSNKINNFVYRVESKL